MARWVRTPCGLTARTASSRSSAARPRRLQEPRRGTHLGQLVGHLAHPRQVEDGAVALGVGVALEVHVHGEGLASDWTHRLGSHRCAPRRAARAATRFHALRAQSLVVSAPIGLTIEAETVAGRACTHGASRRQSSPLRSLALCALCTRWPSLSSIDFVRRRLVQAFPAKWRGYASQGVEKQTTFASALARLPCQMKFPLEFLRRELRIPSPFGVLTP